MSMKPILLIGDSPVHDSPYIQSYIEVYEKHNIPYDLLYWNRHMENVNLEPNNHITYDKYTEITYPYWRKVIEIGGFARFVKNHLKKKEYSYVVVFTIIHAVFMSPFLKKYYNGRFIFDIRDYSPICNFSFGRTVVKNLVKESATSVISSGGFLRWLPTGASFKYTIAHNTTSERIKNHFYYSSKAMVAGNKAQTIKILTIGQIAYYESQKCLIDHLANEKDIKMNFVGEGPSSKPLQKYVKDCGFQNITFSGRYDKKDEMAIVEQNTMINIWLKHGINTDSCMANRFYLSVQMRKPMIVSRNSYQGHLCEKYGLGVTLEENDNFGAKINEWWTNFVPEKYDSGCRAFLNQVNKDIELFEQKLVHLYKEISKNL